MCCKQPPSVSEAAKCCDELTYLTSTFHSQESRSGGDFPIWESSLLLATGNYPHVGLNSPASRFPPRGSHGYTN